MPIQTQFQNPELKEDRRGLVQWAAYSFLSREGGGDANNRFRDIINRYQVMKIKEAMVTCIHELEKKKSGELAALTKEGGATLNPQETQKKEALQAELKLLQEHQLRVSEASNVEAVIEAQKKFLGYKDENGKEINGFGKEKIELPDAGGEKKLQEVAQYASKSARTATLHFRKELYKTAAAAANGEDVPKMDVPFKNFTDQAVGRISDNIFNMTFDFGGAIFGAVKDTAKEFVLNLPIVGKFFGQANNFIGGWLSGEKDITWEKAGKRAEAQAIVNRITKSLGEDLLPANKQDRQLLERELLAIAEGRSEPPPVSSNELSGLPKGSVEADKYLDLMKGVSPAPPQPAPAPAIPPTSSLPKNPSIGELADAGANGVPPAGGPGSTPNLAGNPARAAMSPS